MDKNRNATHVTGKIHHDIACLNASNIVFFQTLHLKKIVLSFALKQRIL